MVGSAQANATASMFLSQLKTLRCEDAALQFFFRFFYDEVLETNDSELGDEIFRQAPVATLRVTTLLGMLHFALGVKSRFAERPAFYQRVRERLVREEGEAMADKLLRGLE